MNLNLPAGLAPNASAQLLRKGLAKVRGLRMFNPHRGCLAIGSLTASVAIEASLLHVSFEPNVVLSPFEALQASGDLPGNVRFAVWPGQLVVLADTQIEGAEAVLPEMFRWIIRGFRLASGTVPRARQGPKRDELVARDRVEAALADSAFEEDAIVRHDHGWELRPRVRGEPVPVQATVDARGLRIYCELLSKGGEPHALSALAHQALRFNSQLRQCRLAAGGACIVAETRLHAPLIEPRWLAVAARAVAVASVHCRSRLEILAHRPEVAERYQMMFLDAQRC
jgi:hypothetical protein